MTDSVLGPVHRWNLHFAHVDGSARGRIAPFPPLLPGPLVCSEVERDEQKEIGAQDAHAGESGKFLPGALAIARQMREVGRTEICIRSEIHESCHSVSPVLMDWKTTRALTEVNHKLSDLKPGDPFLPPHTDSAGALEIIPVHHHMHQ